MNRAFAVPLVATLLLPGLAGAELLTDGLRYTCDRSVEVPASYITASDGAAVVLQIEGRQITLLSDAAASGARFSWPSDKSGYVWWTKGDDATLSWQEAGQETVLLTCKAMP